MEPLRSMPPVQPTEMANPPMASMRSPDPLTSTEVTDLRSATPGVAHRIHLNHAGSSLPSDSVLAAQVDHLKREAEIGGYEAAAERTGDDAAVYESIAGLIGAKAREIARAEHATTAWNSAFWSVPMAPGQRILTARAAYGANAIGFLRAVERRGVRIEVVPDDEHGQIDVDELARRIDSDVALVALTHIPTNGGLVNPAERVGEVTRHAGVTYLLDACQSVGQRVIDVAAIGCDLLSATGRKYLRGPRGTGFVYASDRIIDRLVPDQPDHHGALWTSVDSYQLEPGARRFEHWEYNHGAWLALGTAVDEAKEIGVDRIEVTVAERGDTLRTMLWGRGLRPMDLGEHRCGIVTVAADGFDPWAMKTALGELAINISVTTPASTRFDSATRELADMLRVSVHYLTTDDELDRAVDAISGLTNAAGVTL